MSSQQPVYNLAIGRSALQSSYSQYSRSDDPLGAISGVKTGGFGFHTDIQAEPWWMLDLGKNCDIERILIFNREDAGQSRVRHLSIDLYNTYRNVWTNVYRAENEFGGAIGGAPLVLNFGRARKTARFVRILLADRNILHLDEVEVFGSDIVNFYGAGIKAALESNSLGQAANVPSQANFGLGAVVGLTRGYKDLTGYNDLLQRNDAIYEKINKHRRNHYPLVIWHEGNISPSQQSYIQNAGKNEIIKFVDISDVFRLPPGVNDCDFEEHWSAGYRLMCKFNTHDIWKYCRDYKFVLRVDEDCILQSLPEDPFEWADAAGLDVGYSMLCGENHALTNSSVPYFIDAYMQEHHLKIRDEGFPYNHYFPYTNVMLSRPAFFLSEEMRAFTSAITGEPDFYNKRWGDLPVIGTAVNMFAQPERVFSIPHLEYRHESHAMLIKSAAEIRAISPEPDDELSSKLNSAATLLKGGEAAESEKLLLTVVKHRPNEATIASPLSDVLERMGRHEIVARRAGRRTNAPEIGFYEERAQGLLRRRFYREAVLCFSEMFRFHSEKLAADAEAFIAAFPKGGTGARWIASDGMYRGADSIRGIFSSIYDQNIWGGGSGGGSFIERVAKYAGLVQYFLIANPIRSVCDIGCGDWQFSQYIDFGDANYTGFDVVSTVIERNRKIFGATNINFIEADASTLKIPPCDLIICKDVLQHLSNESALMVAKQFEGAPRCLITNDFADANAESRNGDTRPLNIMAKPFSLPGRPLFTFDGKVTVLVERKT